MSSSGKAPATSRVSFQSKNLEVAQLAKQISDSLNALRDAAESPTPVQGNLQEFVVVNMELLRQLQDAQKSANALISML